MQSLKKVLLGLRSLQKLIHSTGFLGLVLFERAVEDKVLQKGLHWPLVFMLNVQETYGWVSTSYSCVFKALLGKQGNSSTSQVLYSVT